MKTAILILNWNGSKDTINCLDSLLPTLQEEDYLFIIDNGSTDNSLREIQDYFYTLQKPVKTTGGLHLKETFQLSQKNYIVCNAENLGFGAGNNIVLKQLPLLDESFELAWLLNNDTRVDQQSLPGLKRSFSHANDLAVAGSLILNDPDNGTIQCSGVKHYKFFGVSKLINKNRPLAELEKNESITFDYLNGASLVLKLEALGKAGYFDERFFLYSEEFDLQLRLEQLGYTLHLELSSRVYHKLAGGTRHKKFLFYYYYNTSAILLSKKHFSYFYTVCAVFNLAAITCIRAFPSVKNFIWGMKGIIAGLKK